MFWWAKLRGRVCKLWGGYEKADYVKHLALERVRGRQVSGKPQKSLVFKEFSKDEEV